MKSRKQSSQGLNLPVIIALRSSKATLRTSTWPPNLCFYLYCFVQCVKGSSKNVGMNFGVLGIRPRALYMVSNVLFF